MEVGRCGSTVAESGFDFTTAGAVGAATAVVFRQVGAHTGGREGMWVEELSTDALPVGVVSVDGSGVIATANRWFAEWAGTPVDSIVGRPLHEFLVKVETDLLPADVGPGPWVMLHAREQDRAVMVTRHRGERGDVLVASEASERFQALTELRRRYALADRTRARLELVMDSAVSFATASSEARLAEMLADAASRAYGAEETTVYLSDGDGEPAIAAGRHPLAGGTDAATIVELVRSRRGVLKMSGRRADADPLDALRTEMRAAGVHALIAAPLHHEDAGFGAFVSWFFHDRSFDDEAAPLAEALAGQAAQTLATLRLQERLAHAATHDEVTGLPNRRLLETQMDHIVGFVACAVLFIDLDGFKRINDRLGHHAGDRMLCDVGRRLLAGVRAEDLVARYGGDEFVVVCASAEPSDALDIAERLLDLLRGGTGRAGTEPVLSASIGVATAPPGSELAADQLIRRADVAMYRAKAAGGNRIVLAEP